MPETKITSGAVPDVEQEEDDWEPAPGLYEVQYSLKWVNFTFETHAKHEEEARRLAYESFKKDGLKEFTVRGGDDENVTSLEDLFHAIPKCFRFDPRVECMELDATEDDSEE
jgi:hypothetical protein